MDDLATHPMLSMDVAFPAARVCGRCMSVHRFDWHEAVRSEALVFRVVRFDNFGQPDGVVTDVIVRADLVGRHVRLMRPHPFEGGQR